MVLLTRNAFFMPPGRHNIVAYICQNSPPLMHEISNRVLARWLHSGPQRSAISCQLAGNDRPGPSDRYRLISWAVTKSTALRSFKPNWSPLTGVIRCLHRSMYGRQVRSARLPPAWSRVRGRRQEGVWWRVTHSRQSDHTPWSGQFLPLFTDHRLLRSVFCLD